ncbi:MAG: hypothetical protein WC758_03275 [Candidatus Woesearchaeota archaeon]
MDVQVSCRKCGKKAPSSEFTIDSELKMAICKACSNERKIAKSSGGFNPTVRNLPHELPKAQIVPGAKPVSNTVSAPISKAHKPADWDETDDLIEKAAAKKAVESSSDGTARLADGRVMHSCRKCKYQFKYDPEDDKPNKCPYCGTPCKGTGR